MSQEFIVNLQQIAAFGLLGVAVLFFVWGRIRYDLVALGALLAGVLLGLIPASEAFSGFSNDVVVIIACALVVSAAISRSGVMEALLRPLLPRLKGGQAQVAALVLAVGLLSMITKNVGALAIFMPIALQLARKTGVSPACLLMPMSFAALMGGLVTLVGTSPNILASEVREQLGGEPFGMFDYTPVGLPLALLGFAFLMFGFRLLPSRRGTAGFDATVDVGDYVVEAKAPEGYAGPGTPSDLQAFAQGEVKVVGLVQRGASAAPLPDAQIKAGDKLLLEGEQEDLDALVSRAGLKLGRDDETASASASESRSTEAVVGRDSMLVDRSARDVELYERFGLNLMAVSRSGERIKEAFKTLRLRPGDVLVVQGSAGVMPEAFRDLGLLPLAERDIRLGQRRRSIKPLLVLLVAMLLVAFEVLPVAVAFFAAAVAMVALGSLPLRRAYESLDGPVLVLVAALIPVSETIQSTGATGVIAATLSGFVADAPPLMALGLVMIAGMAVTPFLNNAATVLVLGPIAGLLARQLGLNPDPFLMAVAIGAACDFLTPIGHQCNTLVMGPGGYRFTDYLRLGAPLSLLVVSVGTPLIAFFWPLTSG